MSLRALYYYITPYIKNPLELDPFAPKDKSDLLVWLNTPISRELNELLRKGLKKSKMRIVDTKNWRKHLFEEIIL